jgi:hypothetical protein
MHRHHVAPAVQVFARMRPQLQGGHTGRGFVKQLIHSLYRFFFSLIWFHFWTELPPRRGAGPALR